MKSIIGIIFGLLPCIAYSQVIDTVEVSNTKTTYILMDSDVNLVDIGTKDYVAVPKENMVIIKAIRENPSATSLMVRTKTGVHVWILKYARDPKHILINKQGMTSPAQASSGQLTPTTVSTPVVQPVKTTKPAEQGTVAKPVGGYQSAEQYARRNEERYGQEVAPGYIQQRGETGNRHHDVRDNIVQNKFYYVLKQKRSIRDIGEISNSIYFMLYDVFVDRDFIYIKVGINNTSSIAFDLDYISFDRAQGKTLKKKEAISNMTIPVEHFETVYTVSSSTEELMVYAIKLFAIQDNDSIKVKLSEMGGVRTISFSIPAKLISTAKSL